MGALVLLALAAGLLAAPPLQVPSAPRQVTVFPQGASVLRAGEMELPAGAATVSFSGIPWEAVESSLRLSAKGPQGTKLFGVQLEQTASSEAQLARRRELEFNIRSLEDKKADLADGAAARQAEIEILKSLGAKAGSEAPSQPAGISSFAQETAQVGRRIAALLLANRKDARHQRQLDEQIAVLKSELQNFSPARGMRVAQADLELASAGTVRFELSYLVPTAHWSPLYDLRLANGEKTIIALSAAAEIRQGSGEDWKGVQLTLSTARPQAVSQLPDPTDWWLDFQQPIYRKNALPASALLSAETSFHNGSATSDPAATPTQTFEVDKNKAEYSTSFVIQRPADILSDQKARRVAITASSHEAHLRLVTVPRLQPAAFIEAEVKYTGEQPLLPGLAQLFCEGAFVGKTQLSNIGPGETFKLSFGRDENIKVERKLLDQKSAQGEGILFTTDKRIYHWVTSVKNHHAAERTLELREQMPRARPKEIRVELLKVQPKPLPEDKERPGLLRWELKLPPRSERKVHFRYQVQFPEGWQVTGLE